MKRPQIEIKPDKFDLLIEAIGVLAILLLVLIPIYYYEQLPEQIPIHFNANGEVDAYDNRGTIWTLPVIGSVLFISLLILSRYPHLFNYLQEITPENAEYQYKNASKMLRSINTFTALLFTYICYSSIQVALGQQQGLTEYLIWIIIGISLSLPLYFFIRSSRKHAKSL
jgi:uncharacterized membrane protein